MSRVSTTSETVEHKITDGLAKGVGKLRELEQEVQIRSKRLQQKLAALFVAILVAVLGVGFWILAVYSAFLEITRPFLAAFFTGSILFALGGLLLYGSRHSRGAKK